jgi:serine/threonine-protein kinase
MAEAGALFGGRYRLGKLLGVGGSASVYQAEDLHPSTEVGSGPQLAIKVLHPHLCSTDAARQAFLREARRLGGVHHPNIAAVHDFGLHDAGGVRMPWIALELVVGPTLAERVELGGPLTPVEAVAVLDQILAGLSAAHASGLVHRDVSPGNVILDGGQMVKLIDFGLADTTGHSTRGADLLLTDAESAAGTTVVGNPAYLSPEQAKGRPVAASGDLYQAGAVLYFLLTGQPPFPRESTELVLRAHLSAPPPVPSALARTPRSLDQIVTTAMAKQPGDRYGDADAFRAALAVALAGNRTTWQVSRDGGQSSYAATRLLPAASRQLLDPVGHRPWSDPPQGYTGSLDYLGAESPPPAVERFGSARPSDLTSTAASHNSAASVAVAVLAGVAVLAVLSAFASTGTSAYPVPSAVSSPSASPAPATSPTPITPAQVSVPTLHGRLNQAEAALRAAGLSLGQIARTASAEAAGTILGQSPDPGELVAPGSSVTLLVASGSNTVPEVAGLSVASATAALESAGFTVSQLGADADPTALVAGCQPEPGTLLRIGVQITVMVPNRPVQPAPSPDPSPTPQASSSG